MFRNNKPATDTTTTGTRATATTAIVSAFTIHRATTRPAVRGFLCAAHAAPPQRDKNRIRFAPAKNLAMTR